MELRIAEHAGFCPGVRRATDALEKALASRSDGEAIYTSGALKPGEALEDIVLEKPLPAGSHQAIAVTTVYDKDGAPVLTTRVPVTINVAE